jgi:hypothetical protein
MKPHRDLFIFILATVYIGMVLVFILFTLCKRGSDRASKTPSSRLPHSRLQSISMLPAAVAAAAAVGGALPAGLKLEPAEPKDLMGKVNARFEEVRTGIVAKRHSW